MNRTEIKLSVALVMALLAAGCDSASEPAAASPGVAAGATGQAVKVVATALADDADEVAQAKKAAAEVDRPSAVKPDAADEPEEEQIHLNAPLEVKRLVVAKGVEGREPSQPATQFVKGESERIYAFVEIGNAQKLTSAVFVSFFKEGEPESGSIRLKVGASPRWRTWAYTRLATEEGKWRVVVRDGEGKLLAEDDFEIVAGRDPA